MISEYTRYIIKINVDWTLAIADIFWYEHFLQFMEIILY